MSGSGRAESSRRLAAAEAPWGWRWGRGWRWGNEAVGPLDRGEGDRDGGARLSGEEGKGPSCSEASALVA